MNSQGDYLLIINIFYTIWRNICTFLFGICIEWKTLWRFISSFCTSWNNTCNFFIGICINGGFSEGLSIIKSSIENNLKQPIKVYYGAETEKDFYCNDIFKKITQNNKNIEFYPVINIPNNKNSYRKGLVTDAIMEDIEDFDGYKAYLAGPPKMIEATEKILLSLGIRKVDMHSDAFYTSYEEER